MIEEIKLVAKALFDAGLADAGSGSLSIRQGDSIFITRRDAMLSHLEEGDLLEVGMQPKDLDEKEVPLEIAFHRAVYKTKKAQAVIFASPENAVAISISDNRVVPQDARGASLIKSASIVRVSEAAGAEDISRVAQFLPPQDSGVVMLKGLGSLAFGSSLSEAYKLTVAIEKSCAVLIALRSTSQARPQSVQKPQSPHHQPRTAIPPGIGVMDRSRYRRGR
jgi:L-fuculose-phosphate aldolase